MFLQFKKCIYQVFPNFKSVSSFSFRKRKPFHKLSIFQKAIPSSYISTKFNPSSSLNILDVTFSPNFSWRDHITTLAKTASKKLVRCPDTLNISPPCSCCLCTMVTFITIWSMALMLGGSSFTALLDRAESKAFHFINSSPLTNSLQSLSLHSRFTPFSLLSLLNWTLLI